MRDLEAHTPLLHAFSRYNVIDHEVCGHVTHRLTATWVAAGSFLCSMEFDTRGRAGTTEVAPLCDCSARSEFLICTACLVCGRSDGFSLARSTPSMQSPSQLPRQASITQPELREAQRQAQLVPTTSSASGGTIR